MEEFDSKSVETQSAAGIAPDVNPVSEIAQFYNFIERYTTQEIEDEFGRAIITLEEDDYDDDEEDSEGSESNISVTSEDLKRKQLMTSIWAKIVLSVFNEKWDMFMLFIIQVYFIILIYDFRFVDKTTGLRIFLPMFFDVVYAVDVVLHFIHKKWKSLNRTYTFPVCENWQITVEMLSIIPLDCLILMAEGMSISSRVLVITRANRLLRFVRLECSFGKMHNRVSHITVFALLFEWIAHFNTLHQISAVIFYSFKCSMEDCWATEMASTNLTNLEWYVLTLAVLMRPLTNKGFPNAFMVREADVLILLVTGLISYFLIKGYILGHLTSAIVHQGRNTYLYTEYFNIARIYMKFHQVDESTQRKVMSFYEEIAKRKDELVDINFHEFLPLAFVKEINIDIYWAVFKHTRLMRNIDMAFLQMLSLKMKSEFLMPGDILYQRFGFKRRMVYIVTGVIEVVSEVDDETPIITFSGGTCIGSSTLLLSYRSLTTVRCSTFCQIVSLHRSDLIQLLKDHPSYQKIFLKRVLNLYKKAVELKGLATMLQENNLHRERGIGETEIPSHISWVKTTLTLLMKNKPIPDDEDNQLNHIQFTAQNLDLYAISEEIDLVTDPICLHSAWPWILQPESQFLSFWKAFILMVTVIAGILLPYYATFVCTPLKYKNIPNEKPDCSGAEKAIVIQIISVAVFLLDVLLQVLTAVRYKDVLLVDWKQILVYRLTCVSFLVDFVACLPLEFSVHFLTGVKGSERTVLINTFSLNRLLKLWKVEQFIVNLESSLQLNLIVIRSLKFSVYLVYFIYVSACTVYAFACYMGSCKFNSWLMREMTDVPTRRRNWTEDYYDPKEKPNEHIMWSLYMATVIICGKACGTTKSSTLYDMALMLGLLVASCFICIYFIAVLCATKMLKNKSTDVFKESLNDLKALMRQYKLKKMLQNAMMSALQTKWQYINGHFANKFVQILPPDCPLLEEVQHDMFVKTLLKVPLFQHVSIQLVKKVATVTEVIVVSPDQTVAISGQVTKVMYVIINGYCQIIDYITGRQQKIIGPGDHFGAIELFLKFPNYNTVRSLTHCRIAFIREASLYRVMSMFPLPYQNLIETVELVSSREEVKTLQERQCLHLVYVTERVNKKQNLHWMFSKWKNTKRKYNILQYLMLPVTIHPDGTFIKYYECIRAVLAYVTCIYVPCRFMLAAVDLSSAMTLTLILDIAAYIDIYLRMHVCYYNTDGILVTDRFKTMVNYLKHGFLLDFIGAFPWEELFEFQKATDQYRFFKVLRTVQGYRIILGFQYFELDINHLQFSDRVRIYKYVGLIFYFVTLAGSFICMKTCYFMYDLPPDPQGFYTKGVICQNLSWIHQSVFANSKKHHIKLSPARVYFYALLWVTSLITTTNFKGILEETNNEAVFSIFLMIAGTIGYCYFLSTIIATRAMQNMDLTLYQEKMHSLVKYLKGSRIHPDLRKDVIEYFETKWLKRKGGDISPLLKNFNKCLREDVLYNIYGNSLFEFSVFQSAGIPFIRALLAHTKILFFMKHGIVLNLNDVVPFIYFIYKGRVDVMGPEGSLLLTLTKGSIIGNFQNRKTARQTLKMEAKTHVEIIRIRTSTFYEILNDYSLFKTKFESLTTLNRDFILPISLMEAEEEWQKQEDEESRSQRSHSASSITWSSFTLRSSRSTIGTMLSSHTAIMGSPIIMKLWNMITLVIGAYITYSLTLYQAAVLELYPGILVVQYILDFLFLLRIYFNFRTPYEDEYGDLIIDTRLIAKRYLQEKCGFILDIFTVLPLEVIAFAVVRHKHPYTFTITFTLLRWNRLPRIVYVIQYLKLHNNKLNINVFWRRSIFLLIVVSLILITVTCMLLVLMQVDTFVQTLNMDPIAKSLFFLHIYNFSVTYFTGGIFHDLLPFAAWSILLCVFMALMMQFVSAIVMAKMCTILAVTSFTKTIYAHRIASIKGNLETHDLSPKLLEHVWQYLVLLWDNLRGTQFPVLLAEAPNHLAEGVNISLFGLHIYTNYVFCTCQKDFLRQLITKVKPNTFFPGNPIVFQSEVNDSMYFIYSGEVEVLVEHRDKYNPEIHHILKQGDVFGVMQGLYPHVGHTNSYRACTQTVILILRRQDWEYLLEYFPDSKEEIYDRASTWQFTV